MSPISQCIPLAPAPSLWAASSSQAASSPQNKSRPSLAYCCRLSSMPSRGRVARHRDTVARIGCKCPTAYSSHGPSSSPIPRLRPVPAAPNTTRARRPVLEKKRRHDLHTRIHARGPLPCAGARPRDKCSISTPSCPPCMPRPRPSRPPYIFCLHCIVPRCRRGGCSCRSACARGASGRVGRSSHNTWSCTSHIAGRRGPVGRRRRRSL